MRVWDAPKGSAAALNTNHPLARGLRELLFALERAYPLTTPTERPSSPRPPRSSEEWNGDKRALFGSPIPTLTLYSIGVLGWTFEALAVAINPESMREAIKKTINGLEDHGMFASDRKRRPGSDVRVMRLNQKMAGRAELEKLLRRAVVVWPEFEDLTRTHLGMMGSKTLAHLERRGLIGEGKKRPKRKPPKNLAELRAKCIQEYDAFQRLLASRRRAATSSSAENRLSPSASTERSEALPTSASSLNQTTKKG